MIETLTPPRATKLSAKEMVEKLASQEEFERNRREGYNLERSLARTALEHVGMRLGDGLEDDIEDAYEPHVSELTPELALEEVVGTLPAFVYGLEGMRFDQMGGRLTSEEFRSMKARAARFNHSVKDMIASDTSLNFKNVTDTVTTLYGVMNRERWGKNRVGYEAEAKWFQYEFEARLRGMQQEVLAKQIMMAINLVNPIIDKKTGRKLPRVIIDTNVSVEDDLRGIDMYVTIDGVTFPIDIKSSKAAADKARNRSDHPKSIITTGISSSEMLGAFRVNTKRARKAAPGMYEKLLAARDEYLALHASDASELDLAA